MDEFNGSKFQAGLIGGLHRYPSDEYVRWLEAKVESMKKDMAVLRSQNDQLSRCNYNLSRSVEELSIPRPRSPRGVDYSDGYHEID